MVTTCEKAIHMGDVYLFKNPVTYPDLILKKRFF